MGGIDWPAGGRGEDQVVVGPIRSRAAALLPVVVLRSASSMPSVRRMVRRPAAVFAPSLRIGVPFTRRTARRPMVRVPRSRSRSDQPSPSSSEVRAPVSTASAQ